MFGNKKLITKLKKEIDLLERKAESWERDYYDCVRQYNQLAEKSNKLHDAYRRLAMTGPKGPPQFTKDDIKSLIRLCPPDKHPNNTATSRLTKILLALRGN